MTTRKKKQLMENNNDNFNDDQQENIDTVLVTGGSGTIGSAIIDLLSAMGYEVINLDIRKPERQRVDIIDIECDVSQENEIITAVNNTMHIGNRKLKAVVCVAGGVLEEEWDTFENTDVLAIEESIKVNLFGQINTVHAALPYLKAYEGDSAVVLTSSVNGAAAYRIAGYSAAKAGLIGFMYGIAKELAQHNIRINAVSPGTTVTELTIQETEKDWDTLRAGTLLNKFTKPEDIADIVAMLIENKSIVGQNVVVDSGQLVKR